MNDFNEIALGGHDRVDVLVGAGGLIDDALVLAAFDAFGGRAVVLQGERLLGRRP